jgi:outer membrane autotransporter protein
VVNAIAQLAPSNADLSAPLVTCEGAREFQNLLSSRLDDSLCSQGSAAENQRRPDDKRRAGEGASGCPDSNKYDGVWLKGFGYFGNQGAHGAFPGYSAKIFGAMAGYDTPVADKTRAGAAIGYARSTINGKAFITNTGFSTYQGMLYIEHEDDDWIADGNVSYGWNDYSKMRHIIFPGIDRTATAKYSGNALTGYLLLGRHFYMEDLEVTPSASLQVTHVDLGAYNETGAGDLNLNTQRQDYAFLQSTLGVNVERSYSLSDATDALPQLHLKWLHELFNPTMQQVATFAVAGSPSFTSAGLSSAADTLNVGASVTVLSCVACSVRTWSVEAAYDYYWRNDNYSAHRVMLEIADRF